MARRTCDRGQAFPVYIVAVAGLLFVALAFVVVGMAGNIRSEAQGAADAAALAAAREARDEVFGGLDLADLKPSDWEKILRGKSFDSVGACGKASSFADLNDATATCVATPRVHGHGDHERDHRILGGTGDGERAWGGQGHGADQAALRPGGSSDSVLASRRPAAQAWSDRHQLRRQ